jgi:DNA polymerase
MHAPRRHLLFLDFETYYDNESYTLRKMTPAEYILDPRFEMILCAVKADNGPHEIIDGPDFPKWLSQFDPTITTTVTFNSLFDNAILAWQYGFVPDTMIDAMAMARALDGHLLSRFNLATLSEHIGIPAKGHTINNVAGMRRADIMAQPQLWQDYKQYALRDNMNCEQLFLHYYPRMPWSERRLMDLVLRCCIEPRFVCDTAMLNQHIQDVQAEKAQLLTNAGSVDKKDIMSTIKFKAALEALGVDVEYKDSPTAKDANGEPKQIPAFSKSDEFMDRLQNDPDPAVAALATARVGLKSTLEETRSGTLWRIGCLPWATRPDGQPRLYSGGTMPIPLRYGGAHTHRLSGDWKMNMQNMPTVRGSRGKSKLRLSLKAPAGHTVVTCDLGQIEARLSAWICGAVKLIEQFAKYDAGDKSFDPYNRLASDIFGRPVNRKLVGTLDEIMGFIGKTGILGLGYGCGKDHFNTMVIRSARAQRVDISQIYTRAVGDKAVDIYRQSFFQLPAGWRKLSSYVESYWFTPGPGKVQFGPVEIGHGYIMSPCGLKMEYADPSRRWIPDDQGAGGKYEYSYRYGNLWHRLYGAKLLENIVQHLARVIVMNAALRIRDRGKGRPYPWAYRFVHQAHDELVFIVPDDELNEAKRIIHAEMVRPPSWGLDIPLVADIGTGASYGEAK